MGKRLIGSVGLSDSGVPDDLLTTKGDTHGYSSTNARIPIGDDDQILTADSSQALGLKWATAGGSGAMTQLVQVTSSGDTTSLSSGTITASDHLYYEIHTPVDTSGQDYGLQFNADTGTNYDNRYSTNDGADSTNTGATFLRTGITASANGFAFGHIKNIAAVEKLLISRGQIKTAGANAPERRMGYGGWENTSDQITSIQLLREGSAMVDGIVFTIWSYT